MNLPGGHLIFGTNSRLGLRHSLHQTTRLLISLYLEIPYSHIKSWVWEQGISKYKLINGGGVRLKDISITVGANTTFFYRLWKVAKYHFKTCCEEKIWKKCF